MRERGVKRGNMFRFLKGNDCKTFVDPLGILIHCIRKCLDKIANMVIFLIFLCLAFVAPHIKKRIKFIDTQMCRAYIRITLMKDAITRLAKQRLFCLNYVH